MHITRSIALAFATMLSACDGSGPAGNTVATVAPSEASLKLGAVGKANGLEVAVIGVETRGQLGMAAAGMKASPAETFVVVRYTLKNTGEAPMGFMDRPGISLIDAKGQTYAIDMTAATMASNGLEELNGMTADLNPNVTAKNVGVWKVDKAAFDKATWKLVLASDPQLKFALK
jgi:hypothetical protein